MKKSTRNLLIILATLIILAPVGLFIGGETFGEGSGVTLWNAPLADYGIPGVTTTVGVVAGYILSGIIGAAVIGGILYFLGKYIAKNDSE